MRRWTLPLLALPLVLPLSAAVARAQAPEIPPGYTVYQVLGPGIDAPPLPFKIEGDRLVAPEGGMVTVTGGRVTEDRIDVTMDVPGATVRFLGTRDGDAFTASILSEIGIDASKHKPRTLQELEEWEGLNFDLIISLSPEAHHAALELTRTIAADVEYWPTVDPTATQGSREHKIAAYRDMRDRLKARIEERFGQNPAPAQR